MFDTMTLTKIGGALCGSLLIFLLGAWVAETIYHVGGDSHGEGHSQAYVIPVEDTSETAEVVEIDIAALLAEGNAEDGEGLWRNCKACHALVAGENGTGPSLYGVVGRDVGIEGGFDYSGSLVAVADVWDGENLFNFLENPKGFAPGTKMSYNGLRRASDRADLIAYLDSLDD